MIYIYKRYIPISIYCYRVIKYVWDWIKKNAIELEHDAISLDRITLTSFRFKQHTNTNIVIIIIIMICLTETFKICILSFNRNKKSNDRKTGKL